MTVQTHASPDIIKQQPEAGAPEGSGVAEVLSEEQIRQSELAIVRGAELLADRTRRISEILAAHRGIYGHEAQLRPLETHGTPYGFVGGAQRAMTFDRNEPARAALVSEARMVYVSLADAAPDKRYA